MNISYSDPLTKGWARMIKIFFTMDHFLDCQVSG